MRIWAPIYLECIGRAEHYLVTIGRIEEYRDGLACPDILTTNFSVRGGGPHEMPCRRSPPQNLFDRPVEQRHVGSQLRPLRGVRQKRVQAARDAATRVFLACDCQLHEVGEPFIV